MFSNTGLLAILLIPALALVVCLLALWGILNPQARRGAAGAVAVCGVLILLLLATHSETFLSRGASFTGTGVWTIIVAALILVAQLAMPLNTARPSPMAARVWLSRAPEASALIGFLIVFLFFSTTSSLFLQLETASTILITQATTGIAAVGITMLMISGEFDLSVGSILAVSSLFFLALVALNVPAPLAAIVGVLTGMGLGLINGLLLVWTRIPSFIVTLGTLQAFRAIALTGIRGGQVMRYNDYFSEPPYIFFHPLVIVAFAIGVIALVGWLAGRIAPNYVTNLRNMTGLARVGKTIQMVFLAVVAAALVVGMAYIGLNQLDNLNDLVRINFFDLLNGKLDFIPNSNFRMSIIWWALIVAVFTVILGQTRYGNAVYATGGNPGAARAQGIPVDSIRIINFVVSGGLAALAGIIAVGRELSVFPLQAQGLELEVIAASVIGGTLLSGGYGSIVGALFGVLITGMLRSGLVQLKIPAEIFQGAIGVILIVTVVVNTAARGQSSLLNFRWLRRLLPTRQKPEAPAQNLETVKR